MLSTVDGKSVRAVPHRADFDALLTRLGSKTSDGEATAVLSTFLTVVILATVPKVARLFESRGK